MHIPKSRTGNFFNSTETSEQSKEKNTSIKNLQVLVHPKLQSALQGLECKKS